MLKEKFVIQSEAKDLITPMSGVQILRCALDDKVFHTLCQDDKQFSNTLSG
jgi:hypothetical protein